MRLSITTIAVTLAVVATTAAGVQAAVQAAGAAPPVTKLKHPQFGNVLARPDRQALYYWKVEKIDFKVHCTGSCARAWPPLIVRSRAAVPRTVPGIKGVFGVVRRPDGRLQLTRNRLPMYTYAHERPGQVLCDNVDGWFVVRV